MLTTDKQFKDWTRDEQTELTCPALRLRRWIRPLFYGPFAILVLAGIYKSINSSFAVPLELVLPCLVFMAIGLTVSCIYGAMAKHPPACPRCRKPMKILTTIPARDIAEKKGYIIGASGHVYSTASGGEGNARQAVEIRQTWYVCESCRRYAQLDPLVQQLIGQYPKAIDEQEQWYAQTARDIAAVAVALRKK